MQNSQHTFWSKTKNKLVDWSVESGLSEVFSAKGARIVMYHGVDRIENKKFNSRFIGVENFEKQIAYFRKNFNVISLSDFFSGNFKKDKFNIAITFDDGYRNNLQYALPVLEKYKMPATFYITGLNNTVEKIIWSDFLDIASSYLEDELRIGGLIFHKKNKRHWFSTETNESLYDHIKKANGGLYRAKEELETQLLSMIPNFKTDTSLFDYWKLMTDEEIIELSRSQYAEIGSHGFYHNNLGIVDHENAVGELRSSKAYLENLIQKNIDSVAYPDGSYTRKVVDSAADMGFKKQLAVNYLFGEDHSDKRILDRYGIYPFYSEKRLGYMLSRQRV